MAALNKTSNPYAELLGDAYDAMPKAVLAAIAVSLAHRLDGGEQPGTARVLDEWQVLHENGIVPQAVPRKLARETAR